MAEDDKNPNPDSKLVNLDAATLVSIIKDLRTECGDYRIKNKELTTSYQDLDGKFKELGAQKENVETLKSQVEQQSKLLDEYKQFEEEKNKADMSDVEKLKVTLQEREIKFTDKEKLHRKDAERLVKEIQSLEKDKLDLNSKLETARIQNVVNSVVQDKGFKFRSSFERDGLLSTVLKKKEDSSYLSDDEIQVVVGKFVDDNLETPPGVDGKIPTKASKENIERDIQRFRELNKKRVMGRITLDEHNELLSLSNKIEEASEK